jgi:predicted nucleic acid-binding Zn ribbon protein
MEYTRFCNTCGKELDDKTGKRKYCNAECYHESHRVKRTCVLCGKGLTFTQKKYCSNTCRNIGHRLEHRAHQREISPEEAQKIRENRKIKLVARAIKWQKENKGKVYAAQVALQNKELVTIIYECHCDHPKKQNHHFDYTRPLEVIKLCPSCHAAEHARLRLLAAQSAHNSDTSAVNSVARRSQRENSSTVDLPSITTSQAGELRSASNLIAV